MRAGTQTGPWPLRDRLPPAPQLAVEALEQEKRDLQTQIAQVLESRQQLAHLKMSLSLEVATYRYTLAQPTCARRHTYVQGQRLLSQRGPESRAVVALPPLGSVTLPGPIPSILGCVPLGPACSPVGPGPEKCPGPRKSPGGGDTVE